MFRATTSTAWLILTQNQGELKGTGSTGSPPRQPPSAHFTKKFLLVSFSQFKVQLGDLISPPAFCTLSDPDFPLSP